MAKASINTGEDAQPVHTRTTADSIESQAVVIAIDGSDSVVGADVGNGLDVDVTRLPALPAGTNNIGDVDVLTAPARVRTTDSIATAPQRAVVMDALTARTVTVVNTAVAASQTDSVLVAAQGAGVKIAVRWFLISNQSAASATSAQFNTKPAGAGTKKQSFQIPASDVRGAGSNDDGWIVTGANEGLTLTTGGQGVDVSFAWFPTT